MTMIWKNPRFTVDPGQITIHDIDIIFKRRGIMVIEVDMRQKYAELLSYGHDRLMVHASEHTRTGSYDPAALPTVIHFPRGNWDVVSAFHARYSLRFVLYQHSERRRRRNVWTDRFTTTETEEDSE